MAAQVLADVAVFQHLPALAPAAQGHFHPRQQFQRLEGLGDVVLGPQMQAPDFIRHLLHGGQKDHRRALAGHPLHHGEAVQARQHHIQQHQVEAAREDALHRFFAVGADLAGVAPQRQGGLDHLGDMRLILHDQDVCHGKDSSFLCKRAPGSARAP